MGKRTRHEETGLSIVEAVETLSSIADLELDKGVGITQTHHVLIQGRDVSYRIVHWLNNEGSGPTIDMVRDVFRVILDYLRNFYKKEYGYITDQQTIEGIKTVMVLVGEAAKKLDKYAAYFKSCDCGSTTDLKEYKQLQEFYHKKINRKIDEGVLGRWILALTQRATLLERPIKVDRKLRQTKHVFIDLESVKKDTEYELFFMRKEDGCRFFSPRLIRNIKLVCDFGDYFNTKEDEDPCLEVRLWQDKYAQASAKDMLKAMGPLRDNFYHVGAKVREHELVSFIKMALMALSLGASPSNLVSNHPAKSCFDYFNDFQKFLRNAINTDEYRKLVAYPPRKENVLGTILVTMIRSMCRSLFIHLNGFQNLKSVINSLIGKGDRLLGRNSDKISLGRIENVLLRNNAAMNSLFTLHSNGPLIKVLDFLQESGHKEFDPLIQHNIPNHWFDLYVAGRKISHDRIPCPTRQDFINKVAVIDEFKEFIRGCAQLGQHHLIFNLQDRTTWREHSRSAAIEDLQKHPDFTKGLSVVTFANDTDFYHQIAPYEDVNEAHLFLAQLREHLEDGNGGYFFPPDIKKVLSPGLVDQLIRSVHRIFFSEKSNLSIEERLEFIQLFHLVLQLKIIEISKADSFSFSCKDGIDIGGVASAQLFIFLSLIGKEQMSDEDINLLNLILYAPPVVIRERVLLTERFKRMLGAVKVLERMKEELGWMNFTEMVCREFGMYSLSGIGQAQSLEKAA